MELKQNTFTFLGDVFKHGKRLPRNEQGEFYRAVLCYAFEDEEPDLTDYPLAENTFECCRISFDNSKIKARNGKQSKGIPKRNKTTHEKANTKQTESETKANTKQIKGVYKKEPEHKPFFTQKIGRSTGKCGIY